MKLRILMFGLVAVLSAACGQASPAATPVPLTPLTVQMSWTFDYSSAPFFTAEKNGHFKAERLEVTLKPGGFNDGGFIEPIDAVINGEAEIGLASATTILQKRAEGVPIVAIGSMMQRSPFALMSLADKNIKRPQDLIGKTVAINDGGARQVYDALLASQNIDPADINTISRTDYGIDPLLNGDIDVLGGWIINEGVLIKESGLDANFILMSDYGVDTYDFVLFTAEETIQQRPEILKRFMTAIAAGIKDVVENPQQGVEYTLQYNPELKAEEQQHRLEAAIPLMNVPDIPFASMQPEVWQATYDILRTQNILTIELDLSEVYTFEFVQSPAEGE